MRGLLAIILFGATWVVPAVVRAEPASSANDDDGDAGTLVVAVGAPCSPGALGRRVRCASERTDLDASLINLFGLRGSVTRVEGTDPTAGLTLISEGSMYGAGRLASVRMQHFALLGAGLDGVEGGIGADYAVGVRAPVSRHQGPLARVGLRAHILADSVLLGSLIEVPQLQLGYQYLDKRLHLELAGRGGAVLIGRYNPAGERRPLGNSLEYGGYATLRWDDVQLSVDYARVDPRRAVDQLSGGLCSIAGYLGACLDARWYRGEVGTRGPVNATYLGVALGGALGQAE